MFWLISNWCSFPEVHHIFINESNRAVLKLSEEEQQLHDHFSKALAVAGKSRGAAGTARGYSPDYPPFNCTIEVGSLNVLMTMRYLLATTDTSLPDPEVEVLN